MLRCNLDAVAVFLECPIDGIGLMGGIWWTGITPERIRSAIDLLRYPEDRWPELLADVGFMGRCVANERNAKAAARPRK